MTSSTVRLTSRDGGSFAAYLSVPTHPNGGAVVVLQEIFGINANMRSVSDDLADKGFIAIAPDLFWRQEAGVELNPGDEGDRERATALMKGMDQGLAVQDALVAAAYVRGLDGSNGKVGAVGYCLGGRLAYLLAMKAGIDAAVSYYGVAIQASLDKMGTVRVPLLLHIAEQDHLCPPDAQDAIKTAAAHGSGIEILSYSDVGHAFARRNSAALVSDAADRADAATLDLLKRELAP